MITLVTGGARSGKSDRAQKIAERLGEILGDDAIRLNEPVKQIRQDDAGVSVLAAGGEWRAQRVVVSTPLAITGHINFDPPLPKARVRLHDGVFMGITVKIVVAYERPFWRDRKLSGQAVGTSGVLSVVFDDSSPDERVSCLLGFVVGRAARLKVCGPGEVRPGDRDGSASLPATPGSATRHRPASSRHKTRKTGPG